MRNQKRNLLIGLLLATTSMTSQGQSSATTAGRARHLARRARDRLRVGRRHLGGAAAAGGDARLLVSHPATESRPLYSPDRQRARVRLDPHRRRRHLRAALRRRRTLTRLTFDDGAESARRLVARRPVDLLLVDDPRHRRHERRVPRARSTAARRCRSAPIATPTSSSARRRPTAARVAFSARGIASHSGGATATVTSTSPRSGWPREGAPASRYTRLVDRGAKDAVADVERRRQDAVLRVRPQRQREHLAGRRSAAPARPADEVHERPRAVADHLGRRQDHRVRARLRHLDARHRERPDRAR